MLYSTVRIIENNPDNPDNYEICHEDIQHDRVDGRESLVPVFGFYHYDRSKGRQKAFYTLKESMIQIRKEQITALEAEIKSIEKLQWL